MHWTKTSLEDNALIEVESGYGKINVAKWILLSSLSVSQSKSKVIVNDGKSFKWIPWGTVISC